MVARRLAVPLIVCGVAGCAAQARPATVTVTIPATSATASQSGAADPSSPSGSQVAGEASSSNGSTTPAGHGAPNVDTRAIREALAAKGYKIPGIDTAGTAVAAAIKSFQRDNGLAATGEADAAFWEAVRGTDSTGGSAASDASSAADTPKPSGESSTSTASRSSSQPSADGASDSTTTVGRCTELFAAWDAAVASGARGSRATATAAHDEAQGAGCNPDKWLPSSMTKVFDAGTHRQGQSCSMSEVAHYDAAGLVCTQDVEGSPHWN